jgi:hypothetical protein
VLEPELTEPSLFLPQAPDAVARLVGAVQGAIASA